MRLTFERAELIQLIGNSLGYTLQDVDVDICAEPFEVRIKNVNLTGLAKKKDTTPSGVTPTEESVNTPLDEQTAESPEAQAAAGVLTMAEILNQNSDLGGPAAPTVVVEEDEELGRPLGPQESTTPPPVTDEELNATARTGQS